MYFDKMTVGIARTTPAVQFRDVSDTAHFKKYKLSTNYLEAPVELRYRFNPEDDRKSVKVAVGAKVGVLINAHVKGVTLENVSNQTINDYTAKESTKRFFNKQRLSLMGRVGVGSFSVFASYAITSLYQEGLGPAIHPMSIGLNISGL
jgi:hypothetical protein